MYIWGIQVQKGALKESPHALQGTAVASEQDTGVVSQRTATLLLLLRRETSTTEADRCGLTLTMSCSSTRLPWLGWEPWFGATME